MKKTLIFALIQLLYFTSLGQHKILPGDNTLNSSFLKPGNYSMAYYIKKDGQYTEVGTYNIEVNLDNQKLSVNTSLSFLNSNMLWKDGFIANTNSFAPVSAYTERDTHTVTLNFSNIITGTYTKNKNGKKKPVNESVTGHYFNISLYPYILRMLPLATGYKATIPVYDYEAEDKSRLYDVVIKEVKSDVFTSSLTGEHKVWKVSVYEESTGHSFDYFFDKETHRLWEIQIQSKKGDILALFDKEIDFNPFKNKFNKEETYALVNRGNSVIKGVTFVRDNKNESSLNITVLNINKKQFAQKGTKIALIPYTNYFKEWEELNKKQSKIKNAKSIPLNKEALECIKYTTVYDDDGHFEFTNLKPGEYKLLTTFEYEHTKKEKEVVGTSDMFYKGYYLGTNVLTENVYYNVNNTTKIQKVVTIKTDGEIVEVKLKKTR